MPRPSVLAAIAALTFGVSTVGFAYSGDLGSDSPGMPVLMQLDATHAASATQATPTLPNDPRPSHLSPGKHPPSKAGHDEFQRYFDRHYRAHLVLDAAAHRFFEAQ